MDYNQEQKQDRKTLLQAAIAVLILLNLVLAYFYYHEKQQNQTKDNIITAKTEEIFQTKSKLDSISRELDLKIIELGGQVEGLLALKAQLEKDKKELIQKGNVSIKDYAQKIKSYELALIENDAEINRLKDELGIAYSKNSELSEKVSTLEEEKSQLTDSVTSYSVQNRELAEKVLIASALKSENLTIHAISAKGKERDGAKIKAKRIDKLKVSFNLQENAIAKHNEKEIYLKILDPNGAVLSDMATGSGTFMVDGKEMIYSSKQNIHFNNTKQAIEIMYGRGGIPMKDGKYAIEVYCEGYKIGQGDFIVK
jgi:hypothetical protein